MRPFLFLLLVLASCYARAEVLVDVMSDGYLQVQADYSSGAPLELVRLVLTDYDHLSDFVPDMHSSRIISPPGHPLQVEQQGIASFLMFSFPLEVVFEIDDRQDTELHFHSIAGNLHDMTGRYMLQPHSSGTSIHYEAHFKPDFQVPPYIGSAIMRREIERQFAGLLKEIDRRHAMMAPVTPNMAE